MTESPFTFVQEESGIQEYVLNSNGLRILLKEDHSAPVVTVMLTYLVGSRHETDQFRGGAHLLEHMMFKGTERYNKRNGNAIAKTLQNTGAHINATTWKDGTNYFETLPKEHLELALDIEADRMVNSLILEEDFKSEMPVVQSEFDRLENSAIVALDLALWDAAYKKHPYHFPIIGIRKDLFDMPITSLQEFYRRYYRPDNAVLALVGDFNSEEVLKLVRKKFETVVKPSTPLEVNIPEEPEQTEKRFVEVKRNDQIEVVAYAHKVPPAAHEDTVVLDVLAQILSNGKTSRFYPLLIETGVAVEVTTDHSKSHDTGLFATEAVLSPQTQHADLEALIQAVYEDVKKNGVTENELIRAKNQLHAHVAYSRDGSYSLSRQISSAVAAGGWKLLSGYLNRLQAVTKEDIKRIAQNYFSETKLTVGYLVSTDSSLASKKTGVDVQAILSSTKSTHPVEPTTVTANADDSTVDTGKPLSERIKTEQVGPIRALSIKTEVDDVVTIVGSFEGGGTAYAKNPLVPALTVELLDEGTTERSKFELANLLESRGAQISFQLDILRTSFYLRCLRQDVDLLLSVISEKLKTPKLDASDLEKIKKQFEAQIYQSMADTGEQTAVALSQAIYNPEHPNYEISFEDQLRLLKETTVDDIRSFFNAHYGPQKMVVVGVGDLNESEFHNSLQAHFADWKVKEIKLARPTTIESSSSTEKAISLADKVKVDVSLGHGLPLTQQHPDYLTAYVANAILGGDFSAKLATQVRDEEGLTYSIYSQVKGIDESIEGHWQVSLILNNEVLQQGIDSTKRVVTQFITNGVTQEELSDKQRTITGSYKVSLSTTGGLAHRILTNEELGFELNYLEEYPKLIDALSLEQVNNAIKKYFDVNKLHLLICGSLNEQAPKNASV